MVGTADLEDLREDLYEDRAKALSPELLQALRNVVDAWQRSVPEVFFDAIDNAADLIKTIERL
jgi:hypothetical protein